jgi:hypothetical protein
MCLIHQKTVLQSIKSTSASPVPMHELR